MNHTTAGHPRHGVRFALGAAVLFGASAPLAKLLTGSIRPQLLAGLLYLGSGVGLGSYRLVKGARQEAPLCRDDVPWLAAAIVFGGVLGPLLLMVGLTRTPASGASLLLNLEGVFTALFAWVIFHENVDRRVALGMFAIVGGGLVLAWEGRASLAGVVGPLAIAGACLSWAVDNNLTQKVSGGDAVQIAALKGVVAGGVNTAIAAALGARMPGPGPLVAALVVGVVSYGVSLVLFVRALRYLGTARTGAYFSTAPFVGAALAIIIFREAPSSALIVAAGLMGVGVWLHLSERHEHEHSHEELNHEHAHVHDDHHQHEHGPDDPPVTDPKPHVHRHRHAALTHSHVHYPDLHHRHEH